jgi:hypothetical protein
MCDRGDDLAASHSAGCALPLVHLPAARHPGCFTGTARPRLVRIAFRRKRTHTEHRRLIRVEKRRDNRLIVPAEASKTVGETQADAAAWREARGELNELPLTAQVWRE